MGVLIVILSTLALCCFGLIVITRLIQLLSFFALLVALLALGIILLVSTMVGAIVAAMLYQFLGTPNIGWVIAGGLAVAFFIAIGLMRSILSKVFSWLKANSQSGKQADKTEKASLKHLSVH